MKKYKLKDHMEFELYNEWKQLDWRVKWNWITCTLIHIYFEAEHHGFGFQIVFLGLGFYFKYNTDKSLKLFAQWDKELKELLKEKTKKRKKKTAK